MKKIPKQDRILGGLYGSLVGDALGVPVEFTSRASCQANPVTDMRGYGTHAQPPGTWSDDGSLLLCSVESLVATSGYLQDMAERFVLWRQDGHWAAHGCVFDIGGCTSTALGKVSFGIPAAEAGGASVHDNGNGSLMRILPVSLAYQTEPEATFAARLRAASSITHRHEIAQLACVFHGFVVAGLMQAKEPVLAITQARKQFAAQFSAAGNYPTFSQIMTFDIGSLSESEIISGGYVRDTLLASLWCLVTTANFSDCVLKSVNLGGDTDTTGCVAGGLAGVCYGRESIPPAWQAALPQQEALAGLFGEFLHWDDSQAASSRPLLAGFRLNFKFQPFPLQRREFLI